MAFKLALDAGHGKYTPGKRCLKSLDPNETREWVLNSRICDKVQKFLSYYDGIEILRVDDTTGETDVSLSTRTSKANNWKADVYISVHHNAGVGGGSGGGVIVIRYTGCSASGETGLLQKKMYDALVAAGVPKGNRSNGTPSQDLHVLRETKMKALLIECGFMDSSTDIKYILTDEFADKCAQGIVNVVVSEGNLTKKKQEIQKTEQILYRVANNFSGGKYIGQVGAYTSLDNAIKKANDTKLKVFDQSGKTVYEYVELKEEIVPEDTKETEIITPVIPEVNEEVVAPIVPEEKEDTIEGDLDSEDISDEEKINWIVTTLKMIVNLITNLFKKNK